MSFLQLAKDQRFSVRKFKTQAVEKEKLDQILEAGRIAPTACNYQPQRILVIENADAHERLKQCTSWYFGAPVVLMVCYDKTTCWKNKTNGTVGGDVDASIVTTHMMLAAAELGLGATWVGGFDHQKARELFGVPDYLVPVALLPIGYPADDASRLRISAVPCILRAGLQKPKVLVMSGSVFLVERLVLSGVQH